MTTTPPAPAHLARDLVERWDAQQTRYIRHRAERFRTIARVVSYALEGLAAPRILDLAGGPGSLGAAVLAAIPHARVVVADKDPALLALAASVFADDDRVDVARIDLDDPSWTSHPRIAAAPFDAVVSSTALHWLQPETLVRTYRSLAEILPEGGLFLNGDHLLYDAVSTPTLRAIAAEDDAQTQAEAQAAGVEDWDRWWDALGTHPEFEAALAERSRVWGPELHVSPPKVTLGFHLETLRSAGFREVDTVWRYLDDHVVCAVR